MAADFVELHVGTIFLNRKWQNLNIQPPDVKPNVDGAIRVDGRTPTATFWLEMGKTKTERLFDYVSQGKVIKVKSFLKRHQRFDLNVVTERRQRTFLHVACASGDDAVLRVLLKHGARVDVQDNDGETPLHLALQRVLHGHQHGELLNLMILG